MVTTVIWTVAFLAFVGLFCRQVYQRLHVLLKTRPVARFDRIPERIFHTLKYAFGQFKFLTHKEERLAGIVHALVFWGFLVLGGQVVILFARGWFPEFEAPLISGGGILAPVFLVSKDLMEAVVFVCSFIFMGRWLITHPRRLMGFEPAEDKQVHHPHWEAVLILVFIAGITLAGLVYDGGRLVFLAGERGIELDRPYEPVAAMIAVVLQHFGSGVAQWASSVAWWTHNLTVLVFLNFLPLAKHFHVVTAIPNVFFDKLEPRGRLSKQDLENTEIFGTSQMEHFDWKQVLDMYTCTECGRCSSMCPATATGKPLAPRQMLLDLRNYLYENGEKVLNTAGEAGDGPTILGEHTGVTDEVIWSCNTCRACEDACPVHIEYVDKIVDIRRHLVQELASFPGEVTRVFKGMETQGNPWGIGADKRADWAEGLDIPTLAENPEAEYLFFVGCAGSFDDRAKKITQAVAKILKHAGVSYAILGRDEPCNGDTARRLGNEYLYQTMAQTAVEVFAGANVKKVITNCPHCFNTIKNEFPQFGGEYETAHASEVVADLIKQGKIKINGNGAESIVFHDSCYLGRYNEVYDPPREILKAIPGTELVEADRSRNLGMCCGAGGGRMWIDEEPDQRVNSLRVAQLLETKAGTIASGCPYCMTMLSDGVKEKQLEDSVKTKDVMEILAERLQG